MTRRHDRGLRTATKAARCSANNHRVGAALFKGRRLIAVGWNTLKTHPDSETFNQLQHAEFSCLMGQYKYDLVGALLYVVRLTRGGKPGISKPCAPCMDWIRACGLRKVIYLDHNGEPVEERVGGH